MARHGSYPDEESRSGSVAPPDFRRLLDLDQMVTNGSKDIRAKRRTPFASQRSDELDLSYLRVLSLQLCFLGYRREQRSGCAACQDSGTNEFSTISSRSAMEGCVDLIH